MENASKALLIAAAVLIVILVIAFGMNIFNSAKTAGDAGDASSAISQGMSGTTGKLEQSMLPKEVRDFNNQFKNLNIAMNGEQAKELGFFIKQNKYDTKGGTHTVEAWLNGSPSGVGFSWTWEGDNYYATVVERDKEGYITKINIEYKSE